MTAHDPAIEAAQRHADTLPYGVMGRLRGDDMAAAAREALRPIRELHRPGLTGTPRKKLCGECLTPWPCATAKLIYRSDER